MNDDIHALSGAYAVDAVDERERADFEQHLAACAECRAEVASFRATTEQLSVLIGAHAARAAARADPARHLPGAAHRRRRSAVRRPPGSTSAVASRALRRRRRPSAGVTPITSRAERRPGTSAQRVNRWFAAAAAVLVLGGGTVAALHPWDRQSQVQVGLADRVIQAPDAQRFQQAVAAGGTATVVRSQVPGQGGPRHREPRGGAGRQGLPAVAGGGGRQLRLRGPAPDGANQTVVLDGDAADRARVPASRSSPPAARRSRRRPRSPSSGSPDRRPSLPTLPASTRSTDRPARPSPRRSSDASGRGAATKHYRRHHKGPTPR